MSSMFLTRVGMATAVLAALSVAVSSAVSAKSLEEELVDLLQFHPQIEASRKSINSAGEEVNQSLSGFYPTVSVNGEIGPAAIDNPTTRARGGSR